MCAADTRREQDAGRGEAVEELLGRIAKLPPEVAGIVASNGECHNSVLEAIASSLATE